MNKIRISELLIINIFLMQLCTAGVLQPLSDEQLSSVDAQALFSLQNLKDDSQGLNFYKMGFELTAEFNLNAKNLQLGCSRQNNADGCDIDISDISFGCVAGASGNCITLPIDSKNNPTQPKGKDFDNSIANQKNSKDFVLTNPFFQFAIKNASTASTREVVGLRIGAEKSEGPLSFGSLNSFSGYLTGKANLTMRGETDVSPVTKDNARYSDASAFLGLQNANIVNLIVASVDYRDLTVNYGTVNKDNLDVIVEGNRVTQANIKKIELGKVVDEIMKGLSVERSCVKVFSFCTGELGTSVANVLMPVLSGGVGNYIKGQLATGLKTSVADLNDYIMPYNLTNVHQIDVNSNSFGIALSQQKIKYPDYDVSVERGWSMYLKDAFTLNINDKVSSLVQNIASSPNARLGNITLLEPAYRNCYGNLQFC